jgi:hypothetical protein
MTRTRGAATAMPPQMVYPGIPSSSPYYYSTPLDPYGVKYPFSPGRSRPPRRRHHGHHRSRRRSQTPSIESSRSSGETGRRIPPFDSTNFERNRRHPRPIFYYPESVPVPPLPIPVYEPYYESDIELGAYLGI